MLKKYLIVSAAFFSLTATSISTSNANDIEAFLNMDDVEAFTTKVKNKVGEEQFLKDNDRHVESVLRFGQGCLELDQLNNLEAFCRQERDVLARYYLLECLPPKIGPKFPIERRLQALLSLLIIYTGLDEIITLGVMNTKKDLIQNLLYEIQGILKSINTTHMLIIEEKDGDLTIHAN